MKTLAVLLLLLTLNCTGVNPDYDPHFNDPVITTPTASPTPIVAKKEFVCSWDSRLDPSKTFERDGVLVYYDCKLDLYCSFDYPFQYKGCTPYYNPSDFKLPASPGATGVLFYLPLPLSELDAELYNRNWFYLYEGSWCSIQPRYGQQMIPGNSYPINVLNLWLGCGGFVQPTFVQQRPSM